MDQIYETELALVRAALWGEEPVVPGKVDWDELMAELRQQTVFGLVSGIEFPEGSVPAPVREQFRRERLRQGAYYYQYMDVQEKAVALLQSNGMKTVVLKGSAAASLYPDPELRAMGDIDLLVAPDDYEGAIALLKADGYVHPGDTADDMKHIGLERDGYSLELHRSFGEFTDQDSGAIMQRHMMYGLEHAQIICCNDTSFPMLPPLENGLVLLRHMACHVGAGIGLRQIIDWMMYVHRCLDDDQAAEEFLTAAETLRLKDLAGATTALCKRYLGLPDDVRWCEGADEGLLDRYMAHILACGNWGRKKGDLTNKVEGHLAGIHSPLDLFRRLQWSGLCNWPAARDNRLLRYCAWIYGAGRFLRRGLGRRNALSLLRQEADSSRELRKLLDDLNVVK